MYPDMIGSDGELDDGVNDPINRPGRDPEHESRFTCFGCGRRLVYFPVDQLHYCRACAIEFTTEELEERARR